MYNLYGMSAKIQNILKTGPRWETTGLYFPEYDSMSNRSAGLIYSRFPGDILMKFQ